MILLYQNDYDDPKMNAQRNLSGRTHFVDDGTLRWHKSRVLNAAAYYQGLLFGLVVSNGDARGYGQGGREYKAVLFDVFGFVIDRDSLEENYETANDARAALAFAVKDTDPRTITLAAIDRERAHHARDLERLAEDLARMTFKVPA